MPRKAAATTPGPASASSAKAAPAAGRKPAKAKPATKPKTTRTATKAAPKPRPSRSQYKAEFAKIAEVVMGVAGLTEEQLATELDVNVRTITNWKLKHPDFRDAVNKGRQRADNKVTQALYQAATGFMCPSVDIRAVGVGKGSSVIEITHYEKFVPGDVFAQQYWLNNRQPELWRAKVEVSVEAVVMDEETARAKFWDRMNQAQERHVDMLTERDKMGLKGD